MIAKATCGLVAAVSTTLAFSIAAAAADLTEPPHYASSAVAPAPVVFWTGVYAGVSAGYGFGNGRFKDASPTPYYGSQTRFGDEPGGFIGGLQVGYAHQIDNFVVGVEGEAGYLDFQKTTTDTKNGGAGATLRSKLDGGAYGAITGRVGYAFGDLLVYNKAGVAVYAGTSSLVDATRGLTTKKSEGRVGWTVGAGLEYAITRSWSAKLEADYFDFGEKSVSGSAGATNYTFKSKLDAAAVKVGVNYRF